MSKCGKGCMPECEYFTTGGCISPFNCQYKIETGYINSATSIPTYIPTYMEKQMSMTAEEIEHCLERFTMGKTTDVMNFDYAGTLAYIQQLKSENAALRKQISEMVMPPCTLGDTLYIVACTFGDGYVEDEIVHQSGFSVVKSVVTEKNFYRMCDLVRNGEAFFSQEAAERELEELAGK